MNFEKFTEKSMNAVREAQNQASVRNSQSIEVCHFLLALLSDSSGLIPELMKSIGVDAAGIRAEVERAADSLPRISGSGYSKDRIYLSAGADKMLRSADGKREKMGDEYLSVEHLMLGILSECDAKVKQIFNSYWKMK